MNSVQASVWQRIGSPSPTDLIDARLQLHWAVQLIAAAGSSFVEQRADDSHRGMVYDADDGRFIGELTATDPPVRLCVRPADLTAFLIDQHGVSLGSVSMAGLTLEDARTWTAEALARALSRDAQVLEWPEYALPDHAVGRGARLAVAEPRALEELARWYANAERVLEEVAATAAGSSTVRVWPHHFDVGLLITLDSGLDPESARSVGVGFSPGDEGIPEPYWYVNAYPRPDASAADLPPLPAGGRWNTDRWFGAMMTGSSVAALSSAEEQRAGSMEFLRAAIASARALLGG